MPGVTFRLRFLVWSNPARRRMPLMVLAAGQSVSPLVCSKRACSLRAPQVGCWKRNFRISCTMGSGVACAQLCGRCPGQSHTKSALSDQLAEEAVVPARALKLEASGTLVLVGLNRVQSHAAQNRQIGGGVILACAGLVLPH